MKNKKPLPYASLEDAEKVAEDYQRVLNLLKNNALTKKEAMSIVYDNRMGTGSCAYAAYKYSVRIVSRNWWAKLPIQCKDLEEIKETFKQRIERLKNY